MEEETNRCLTCFNKFDDKIILSEYKCPYKCKIGKNGDWFCADCIKSWNNHCKEKFNDNIKCPLCRNNISNKIKKYYNSNRQMRYGIFNYIALMNLSRYILQLKIKFILSICIYVYYYNRKLEVRLYQINIHHYILILFVFITFVEVIIVLPFLYIINYGYS